MHPDFDRIVGLCTARHPTTVTTNGSLLDRRYAAVRKLRGVTVSIQSLEPEVYRWLMGTPVGPERVLKFVDRCIRDGTPIMASCVVTTRNISEIPWMTECLADLGVRQIDLHGILLIRPGNQDLYVPLAWVASDLEARWGAPEPQTTKARLQFSGPVGWAVDMVYQFCSVGWAMIVVSART